MKVLNGYEKGVWSTVRFLGVYIHIPFCVKKCVYCDFLSKPATQQRQLEYMGALRREIQCESFRYADYRVKTIFFGGGTPSILEAAVIESVLDCLRQNYKIDNDVEITLEMNPGTADKDKLIWLKKAGINRLSIGLQSADNAELMLLGRIHTYEDFIETYNQAREAGFENINIDLISALPGQNMESWIRTLEKVTNLQPEHISAYSLIIEAGTVLYDRLDKYPPVPDEDVDRRMYQMTKQVLAENAYHRYEISNYAKSGYACRHNNIYWQRGVAHITNYVGFGLGASSLFENVRWKNTEKMENYLRVFAERGLSNANGKIDEKNYLKEYVKEDIQELSKNDQMEEFMFLGLRMMQGVSKQEFVRSFDSEMDAVYGEVLQKWIKKGMLVQDGDYMKLTDAGIDISNVVLADFLLDA
ncbi:MAG: radical SAM family heme chaperone HemW [Lachnospiraceae bacterium]|nr:radical SAM family heme chaperone HemW [Lachnospiraceae bacterium]